MQYAVKTTVPFFVPPLSSTTNPLQTEEDGLELVPQIITACMTRNNLHASQAMSEVRIKNVTSAFSAFSDQVSQRGTMSIIIRA
jgi:hypothetical protein